MFICCLIVMFILVMLALAGIIEHYGEPPGMNRAISTSDISCCHAAIASPSPEVAQLQMEKCKVNSKCYRGWETGPLELQANSASSISHAIEISA
jgi:hypothetical protein